MYNVIDMMKKEDNEQLLVDLECYFHEYYKEHISRSVSAAVKEVEKKQSEEYNRLLNDGQYGRFTGSAGAAIGMQMAQEQARRSEWGSKQLSDIMKMSIEKLYGGEDGAYLSVDMANMAASYKAALLNTISAEKFAELSKRCPHQDLALDLVNDRFKRMMLTQIIKDKEVPKSTIEYLVRFGSENSLMFMAKNLAESNDANNEITEKYLGKDAVQATKDFYKPSIGEKVGEGAVSLLSDTPLTILTGGGTLTKTAAWVSFDAACHMVDSFGGNKEGKGSMDQVYSEAIFGDSTKIDKLRSKGEAKKASHGVASEVVALNRVMAKPLKSILNQNLRIDHKESKEKLEELMRKVGNDGQAVLAVADEVIARSGIHVNKEKALPDWMQKGDLSVRAHNCAYYLGILDDMVKKGSKRVVVGKNTLTLQQVAQRGYDYARSAILWQRQMETEQEEYERMVQAEREQGKEMAYQLAYQQEMQLEQQRQRQAVQASLENVAGWGSLLDKLGLKGFSTVGKNFGYVLATLPDMLIGLFTGKLTNFNMKENLWPIASIILGMFVRNPLMKLLLIGLGGANLLNKAGHAAMGIAPDTPPKSPTRLYINYPDEPLSARLKDPVIKGNTMLVGIDNQPCHVTISDMAIDAYEKGKLPLNTLANAILKNYDRQQYLLGEKYADASSRQQDEKEIKMRV